MALPTGTPEARLKEHLGRCYCRRHGIKHPSGNVSSAIEEFKSALESDADLRAAAATHKLALVDIPQERCSISHTHRQILDAVMTEGER